MITCFPELGRDELLYSGCARYAARMRYRSKLAAVRDLFGGKAMRVDVSFPTYLERLVNALAPGSPITLASIIEGHTMVPFHRPFQAEDWERRARLHMRGPGKGTTHPMRIRAYSSNSSACIRYCVLCAENDLKTYGERYWHRIHQAPGCAVCPDHEVFLEATSIPLFMRHPSHELLTADEVIKDSRPRQINHQVGSDEIQLRLAKDIQWLFQHSREMPPWAELSSRYAGVLRAQKIMSRRGMLSRSRWRERYESFMPTHLRQQLGQPVEWLSEHWHPHSQCYRDAFMDLLIGQMLGYSLSELVAINVGRDDCDGLSWTCHNPAATHYGQSVPMNAEVGYTKNKKKVTLTCECGFIYASLLDPPQSGSIRRVQVLQYGQQWEKRLQQLWNDSSLNLVRISKVLRICKHLLKREAGRLNLPTPRTTLGSTTSLRSLPKYRPVKYKRRGWTLAQHRRRFAQLLRRYPGQTRTFLCRALSWTTNYLRKHDPEWLERHLPQARPQRRRQPTPRDWERLDAEFSAAVRLAAAEIQGSPGRPIRLTRHQLLRACQRQKIPATASEKLPRTMQLLATSVETQEAFALRRIRWALNQPGVRKGGGKRWVLLRISALSPATLRNTRIRAAVQDALKQLGNTLANTETSAPPLR